MNLLFRFFDKILSTANHIWYGARLGYALTIFNVDYYDLSMFIILILFSIFTMWKPLKNQTKTSIYLDRCVKLFIHLGFLAFIVYEYLEQGNQVKFLITILIYGLIEVVIVYIKHYRNEVG